MRRIMTLSAFALALTAICLAAGDEPASPRRTKEAVAPTASKAAARAPAKPGTSPATAAAEKATARSTTRELADTSVSTDEESVEKESADEAAICKTAETYVKAYGQGDAKAVAAHFTPNAEYVDEQGSVFRGRQAIEDSLTANFADNPGSQLKIAIDTIRFVGPGVAIEDGTSTVTSASGNSFEY